MPKAVLVRIIAVVLAVAPATLGLSLVPATAGPDARGTASAEIGVRSAEDIPAAVISLGDSYSSGLGAGSTIDDCDRTSRAWGLTIFGSAVTDRTLLACSGAGIPEVAGQVEQLAALPRKPGTALITVTVGGNDIDFTKEIIICLTPFVSCLEREPTLTARINDLHEPLVDLYRSIQAAAPGDEIIVGGYPLLVPDPDVRPNCSALTHLLSPAERHMIRRLGAALNDAIDGAAQEAGVLSAASRLEEVFDGHEACDNRSGDWLYGLKFSLLSQSNRSRQNPPNADESSLPIWEYRPRWDIIVSFIKASFHPNDAGQAGYAHAFERAWADRSSAWFQ
jgi:hypothetical protein